MNQTKPELLKWPESNMTIRFSDCDLFGHLNNVWYVKYFLDAREEHLAHHYGLSLADFAKQGIGWVVASNQISYFKPALVNESVRVRTGLLDYQEHQLLVEMQMLDYEASHYKSVMWTRFVPVSMTDKRKTKHTNQLMEFFGQIKTTEGPDPDFNQRMNYLRGTPPGKSA